MSFPKIQPLLILILLLILCTHSQQTAVKTAILTPLESNNNGAEVMFNIQEVSVFDTYWDVNILHQTGWNFIIKTDETFGIDTTYDSTIEFTTNINGFPNTQELLFAFTTDNKQYISMLIPMDSFGKINKIYPSCQLSSTSPTAIGDIAAIPQTDRSCDIANGDCINWDNMLPFNTGINSKQPNKLTFIIKYSIQTNEIIFSYQSSSFAPGFRQKCRFASDFISTKGLKMYIAGDTQNESYQISSFEIKSIVGQTTSPTQNPSETPTTETPTSTTNKPTNNPIIQTPTIEPSPFPTILTNNPTIPTPAPSSSNNPTLLPTNNPSTLPTYNPTKYPTYNPTISPINNPTLSPTNNPSTLPTYNP
eukprot:253053_1